MKVEEKVAWGDDGDTRSPFQFAEDARRRENGLPPIIRTAQVKPGASLAEPQDADAAPAKTSNARSFARQATQPSNEATAAKETAKPEITAEKSDDTSAAAEPKPAEKEAGTGIFDEAIIAGALLRIGELSPTERKMLRLRGLGVEDGKIPRMISTISKNSVLGYFSNISRVLALTKAVPKLRKRPMQIEIAKRHFAMDPEYVLKYGPK